MIRALANIINSPQRKKRRSDNPAKDCKFKTELLLENLPNEILSKIDPADKCSGSKQPIESKTLLKNNEPMLPITGGRMKIVESIMVYELWNWYQQNVDQPSQSEFTNWCGLGIGVPGMSKKLRNPKYHSDKCLAPEKYWYSGCGHRQKMEMHLIHKKNHPEVADTICGACHGTSSAMATDKVRNEALRDCLDLQTGLWKHKWPNNEICIDVGHVLDHNLKKLVPEDQWDNLNSTFEFQSFRKGQFTIHRYDAPKVNIVGPTGNVSGATYPTDFVPGDDEILESLNDGSFGLVVFPTDQQAEPDFVFMGDSYLSNRCIRTVSELESVHIMKQKTVKRAGAATGQFIPLYEDYTYDPKALSNATKNDRVYRINPHGDTTIMKLDYWSNHSNAPKHARVVGKDIVMHRLTHRAKRALAEREPMYRQKLLAKMRNNFLALVAVNHQQLYTDGKMTELWSILVESIRRASSMRCQQAWKRVDDTISLLDIVLLEWNCCYGEDITHQATKFHVDGKGPETYCLWGKVAVNENGNDKDVVDSMTPGMVVFPHHGMFMRVRCGRDMVTMSLKRTIHGGDNSRGRRNFSSVDWNGRR